eukprot:TRINITY_DN3555_c0_g1_i5.p1 TRINITY_DN3555_c0_g1~~TRINITY_DN3555_c0_g1_i5.p1  ORF type:complete len:526 (+),score=107.89 TRINITY_DN3555_c0_g1_i5:44-1621(+)
MTRNSRMAMQLTREALQRASDGIISPEQCEQIWTRIEEQCPHEPECDPPATDLEDFSHWGNKMLEWIVKYRSECGDYPVISQVAPNYLRDALPAQMPEQPEPWRDIMSDLDSKIMPGLTHWEASNKFHAYFKPHSSLPAVLGETLCAGINVMGFDWIASPACTELEVVCLDWLAQLLQLPPVFRHSAPGPGGGVIQGSAGESAIVAILAALTRAQEADPSLARHTMEVVTSDQAHAIITKACMVLGLHCRTVPTSIEHHFAMQPADLEQALQESAAQGFTAVAVVATTGTTSSCAFDPVDQISAVCQVQPQPLWLHIDAAYGGAYACLPEMTSSFIGCEKADSFCVNCHKKLLCPFDLAVLYVRDRAPILSALSLQPEYLRNAQSESGAVVDFEHWQMPLGRRFRALKLWFVMRRFGAEGIREHIRRGMELAGTVEELVRNDGRFEMAVPRSLSLVCFCLKSRDDALLQELLARIKRTGECFVIHTKLADRLVIRFACGGIETNEQEVRDAWAVIAAEADAMGLS